MYGVRLFLKFIGGKMSGEKKIWEFRKDVNLPFAPFAGLILEQDGEGGAESIIIADDASIVWNMDDKIFEVYWIDCEEELEEATTTAAFLEDCDNWELINKWDVKREK